MNKLFAFTAVLLLLSFTVTGNANPRYEDNSPTVSDWISGSYNPKSSLGLLDPSRLTVSHSVSFGGSFGSGGSVLGGLYATNFRYRLSDPLTIDVMLGLQNLKYSGVPGYDMQNDVIGSFRLDYRPSKNWLFRLEMNRGVYDPYYYRDYSTYYDPVFGDRFSSMSGSTPADRRQLNPHYSE